VLERFTERARGNGRPRARGSPRPASPSHRYRAPPAGAPPRSNECRVRGPRPARDPPRRCPVGGPGGRRRGAPRDARGGGCEALRVIGIDLDEVRRRIEEAFGQGALERSASARRRRGRRNACGPSVGHIPFTPRAKKVLELAVREAKALRHDYIGTEHILLGLVRERDGLAVGMLAERHVSDERVRTVVSELLSGN